MVNSNSQQLVKLVGEESSSTAMTIYDTLKININQSLAICTLVAESADETENNAISAVCKLLVEIDKATFALFNYTAKEGSLQR